jgi:AraC family transcriptional regulator
MVRAYQEPVEVKEELLMPTAPDIFLTLITSGVMHVECRALDSPWISYATCAGDLFLTPGAGAPYALRWMSLSPEPIQTLHLHLNQHLFVQTVEELADRDPARLTVQDRSGFQDPLLSQLGLALQREVSHPLTADRLYADTVAQMMVVHLLRHYATLRVTIQEYTQGLSRQQMRSVTDFVLAHLHEPPSLERLAQQVNLSAYHFARLFRRTTGESPHQFVLRKRLEAAKRLLRETELPLSQIAVAVGFPNQSHFTQVFREHQGLTPRRYRQHR